jgi:thioredoxin 1
MRTLFALALLAAPIAGLSLGSRALRLTPVHTVRRCASPTSEVIDISSTEQFDEALKNAGDSLVVVDYSTSWCGPCKIIAPKFDEFSETYKDVAFLKVMGDSSPEADKLMRSQGVRALPSFHFWKSQKMLDSISGAKTQALQDAIEANM